MSFNIQLIGLDSFDEGVEFGYRNLNTSREWIPLQFFPSLRLRREQRISIGQTYITLRYQLVNIRGYITPLNFGNERDVRIKICGGTVVENYASLNFRWLQTVIQTGSDNDTVYLDNVSVTVRNSSSQDSRVIFADNFDDSGSAK